MFYSLLFSVTSTKINWLFFQILGLLECVITLFFYFYVSQLSLVNAPLLMSGV